MSKLKRTRNFSDIPSLDVQYANIMKNFDFSRICEFMNWNKSYKSACNIITSWKIFISETKEYKVPTESELRNYAGTLLRDVIRSYKNNKSNYIAIATGPFKAICRCGILELDCVIISQSGD